MHDFVPMLLGLTASSADVMQWLEQAYYPALFLVFVIAALGAPIPEDVPLLAAGFLLRTHPHIATWTGTFAVALAGVAVGDTVLYLLGYRFGRGVVRLRWIRWLATPQRIHKMTESFHRWGVLMCIGGRLVVGIRAVMCMTAGMTRFPYWKFMLADLAGALVSVPLFVCLGYGFAHFLPQLQKYVAGFQVFAIAAVVILIAWLVVYEWRKIARKREALAERKAERAARRRRVKPADFGGLARPRAGKHPAAPVASD